MTFNGTPLPFIFPYGSRGQTKLSSNVRHHLSRDFLPGARKSGLHLEKLEQEGKAQTVSAALVIQQGAFIWKERKMLDVIRQRFGSVKVRQGKGNVYPPWC